MRSKVIEITWHNREGGKNDMIMSCEFHECGILVTGGADNEVKFWNVDFEDDFEETLSNGQPPNHVIEYKAGLKFSDFTVNCVRFNPSGDTLAIASDDGRIFLVKPKTNWNDVTSVTQTEFPKTLRGVADIQDIAWSPNGKYILAGAVDHTLTIYNAMTGRVEQIIDDAHSNYVQGVSWDPLDFYLVSASCDRTVKIHTSGTKGSKLCSSVSSTSKMINSKNTLIKQREFLNSDNVLKKYTMFVDENLTSFFRRQQWSPDGSFLLLTTGIHKDSSLKFPLNATYLYLRGKWSKPAAYLLCGNESSIGVKFNPKLFCKASENESSFLNLPYKIIFAVATLTDVIVYNSESLRPIALLKDLHCAEITDIAWSKDGSKLIITSQDGYCSLVKFSKGEFGEELDVDKYPKHMLQNKVEDEAVLDETKDSKKVEEDLILIEKKEAESSSKISKKRRVNLINFSEGEAILQNDGEKQENLVNDNMEEKLEPSKKKRRVTLTTVVSGEMSELNIQLIPQNIEDEVDNMEIEDDKGEMEEVAVINKEEKVIEKEIVIKENQSHVQ